MRVLIDATTSALALIPVYCSTMAMPAVRRRGHTITPPATSMTEATVDMYDAEEPDEVELPPS